MKTKPKQWMIVEKNNHNAVHQHFGQSKETAIRFLAETVPVYVARGYYSDKTLTQDSFEVIYK